MSIRVELYGIPRQRAGTDCVTIETGGAEVSLAKVLHELGVRFPALAAPIPVRAATIASSPAWPSTHRSLPRDSGRGLSRRAQTASSSSRRATRIAMGPEDTDTSQRTFAPSSASQLMGPTLVARGILL